VLKPKLFSYLSRKRLPCARRISATSKAGRLILFFGRGLSRLVSATPEILSRSSGLIVVSKWRRDKRK
jgi:uncharacterized phosphosugar-binding protein